MVTGGTLLLDHCCWRALATSIRLISPLSTRPSPSRCPVAACVRRASATWSSLTSPFRTKRSPIRMVWVALTGLREHVAEDERQHVHGEDRERDRGEERGRDDE